MYRITSPRTNPDSASRVPPVAVRTLLAILAAMVLALLSYYVHVLQEQVVHGQLIRAQLQQSGARLAVAPPLRGTAQVVAARQ